MFFFMHEEMHLDVASCETECHDLSEFDELIVEMFGSLVRLDYVVS